MARARRSLVERRVRELLAQCDVSEPPVDVEQVAETLGADVRIRRLASDLSGLMQRQGDTGVLIAVNSTHGEHRRRFTLGHELGHWLLGHQDAVDNQLYRNELATRGESTVEIEANAFAAALLMPEDWLRKELGAGRLDPMDEDEIDSLARRYDVSQQAMTFRLINLGLMTT